MLRSSQYVNSQRGCTSVLGAVSGFPGLSASTLFPFWRQRACLETPGREVISPQGFWWGWKESCGHTQLSLHTCLPSPAAVPLEPTMRDLNFSHSSLQPCDKGMGLHCSPSNCTAFSLADRLLDSRRGATRHLVKREDKKGGITCLRFNMPAAYIVSSWMEVSRLRVSSKLCVGWN